MDRLKAAPTRSNLLRLRETLELAQEGHEILDRKREVLTSELLRVAHDAARLQEDLWEKLATAYETLEVARLSVGREHLEWAALSVNETIEVDITPHSVMGVVIPSAEAHGEPPETPYGLGDTTVALDHAVVAFRRVIEAIPLFAETLVTTWRLARELQKTQRRVNALEHIFIPQYRETVEWIENALEEREREETFRLKRLKSRATERSVGPAERQYERPYRDLSAGKRPSVYRDIGGGKATSRESG
ncbi:MAG: V-type ATP synthase subunit D [Chloroflexota bacterium]|nr:V-type ATP synthase subunit D [Chloroflexota bacterium]